MESIKYLINYCKSIPSEGEEPTLKQIADAATKELSDIEEARKQARKEGIKFTVNLLNKHGMAKTFNDRIQKEINK